MSEDIRAEEIKRRLRLGDYLELSSTAGTYEVWAEPYGNPPQVFYEGEPYPIEELDFVVGKILQSLQGAEVRARWVGKRDD
ncbi:hypothetical protein MYX77_06565 [Acidobacteriia bacterium AH_259_A11_L15]|nr:hypothetical protein [Acidobacteriia bacterium AH_259_A11_L15]